VQYCADMLFLESWMSNTPLLAAAAAAARCSAVPSFGARECSKRQQYVIGDLSCSVAGGVAADLAAAVAQFQLAAAQDYDKAQCCLGVMYQLG